MDLPTTFTDCLDRSWTVELGLPMEARIKEITGLDLDDLVPQLDQQKESKDSQKAVAPLQKLMAQPRKFFDLFYAMVKPQADKLGLTVDQVKEGFATGAAIESMTLAVLGAVVLFFRWDHQRNWVIPMMVKMQKKIGDEASKRVESAIDNFDIGKALDEHLAKQGNANSAAPDSDTPAA